MALVRPEQLVLGAEGEGTMAGVVTEYEYYGHDAVVRVRPDRPCGPDGHSLVVRVIGVDRVRPGDRVGWPAGGRSGPGRIPPGQDDVIVTTPVWSRC